jgi:hypothetical protein
MNTWHAARTMLQKSGFEALYSVFAARAWP